MLAPISVLTLHDSNPDSDTVSPSVAKHYSGSEVVGPAPLQVADGVLRSAPTGGGADY